MPPDTKKAPRPFGFRQAAARIRLALESMFTPREFAITEPSLPWEWSARLEEMLQQVKTPTSQDGPDPDALRALGEAAVFVWRMQKRAASADPPLDRKLNSAINRIAGQLADLGCVIQDCTGQKFITGWDIDVRAFQPAPGVTEETVAETLRPAVYFKSHHIVRGDVVVSVPPASGEIGESSTKTA